MIVEICNGFIRSNCKRDFQSGTDLNYFQSLELSHIALLVEKSNLTKDRRVENLKIKLFCNDRTKKFSPR